MRILRNIVLGSMVGISTLIATAAVEQRAYCPDQSDSVPRHGQGIQDYLPFLTANKIRVVSPTYQLRSLQDFIFEYHKFPAHLRNLMIANGASIHLVFGQSVMESPAWNQDVTSTFDGRNQAEVAGAGGAPFANKMQLDGIAKMQQHAQTMRTFCRQHPNNPSCANEIKIPDYVEAPTIIVANKLGADHHGSVNLVLHEHAHSLDSLYADQGISTSPEWQALHGDEEIRDYMRIVCKGNGAIYCLNNSNESFAELFAYYHACQESKSHLEKNAARLASYFRSLTPRPAAVIAEVSPVSESVPVRVGQRERSTREPPKTLEQAEEVAEAVFEEAQSAFKGLRRRIFGRNPQPNRE